MAFQVTMNTKNFLRCMIRHYWGGCGATNRYVLNHNWKRIHRLAGFFGGSIFGTPAADITDLLDFLDTLLTGREPAMREFLGEGKRVAAVT